MDFYHRYKNLQYLQLVLHPKIFKDTKPACRLPSQLKSPKVMFCFKKKKKNPKGNKLYHLHTPPNSRFPEAHLMPVESGLVDLFHRAWGQVVNKPERNKNVDFLKPTSSNIGGCFPDPIGKERNQSMPFSSEMNQNGSTVKSWLIPVEQSTATVLTRTEWLHSSSLSGSRGLWSDQWCPGSTASAPLLSEGHTSVRSGWAERSKIMCHKEGEHKSHAFILVKILDTIIIQGNYSSFMSYIQANQQYKPNRQICGQSSAFCLPVSYDCISSFTATPEFHCIMQCLQEWSCLAFTLITHVHTQGPPV